jgi:hypothetical protein
MAYFLRLNHGENHEENHQETAKIVASGFLTHSARNRPNSRMQFLSASFYVPECYCTVRRNLKNTRRHGLGHNHTLQLSAFVEFQV